MRQARQARGEPASSVLVIDLTTSTKVDDIACGSRRRIVTPLPPGASPAEQVNRLFGDKMLPLSELPIDAVRSHADMQ